MRRLWSALWGQTLSGTQMCFTGGLVTSCDVMHAACINARRRKMREFSNHQCEWKKEITTLKSIMIVQPVVNSFHGNKTIALI